MFSPGREPDGPARPPTPCPHPSTPALSWGAQTSHPCTGQGSPMSELLKQPQTPAIKQPSISSLLPFPSPRNNFWPTVCCMVQCPPHPHPMEGQAQRVSLSSPCCSACLSPQISPLQPPKITCRWASEGRLLLRVHGDGLDWVPWPLSAPHLPEHLLLPPSPRHYAAGTKLSAQFLLRDGY